MAKYSKEAGNPVATALHAAKHGPLNSGSGAPVTSRQQAIALGLSEARKEGAKVPQKSTGKKATSR